MKERAKPITSSDAKRSLQALEILSGKTAEPANRAITGKRTHHEAQIRALPFNIGIDTMQLYCQRNQQ